VLLVESFALVAGQSLVRGKSHPPGLAVLGREAVEELETFGDPAQTDGLLKRECGEQPGFLAFGREVQVPVTGQGPEGVA
jgi:hypothetical protein